MQVNYPIPGLYVHIPFCKKRCPYCSFYSVASEDETLKNQFLNALEKEIILLKETPSVFSTLYLGGGTPTELKTKGLGKLLDIVFKHLTFLSPFEFTVEMNPDSFTPAIFALLKNSDCNRISIGAQSKNDTELKVLERIHTFKDTCRTIELLKENNFANFNLDLIFAIPGQTLKSWEGTLIWAGETGCTHISTYELTLHPGTHYSELFEQGKLKLPKPILKMYKLREETLPQFGFERYEISNYAKKDYPCHHNLIYWNHDEYIGLGPGASSFVKTGKSSGLRWTNRKDLKSYLVNLSGGLPPPRVVDRMEKKELILEELFLKLRTREGITLTELKTIGLTPGKIPKDLAQFFQLKSDRLSYTERGILVADRVILELENFLKPRLKNTCRVG